MKILQSYWILIFGLLLIIVLGTAFYAFSARGTRDKIAQQVMDKQKIISRAEVSNITIFFEKFGDGVATLAQINSVVRLNAEALNDLNVFMDQRRDSGIIGGVVLTDKEGIVKFNANVLRTSEVGESWADRQFFTWAKTEAKKGEYYISRPMVGRLGVVQDQTLIAVASPVYRNDKFSGVVASSVKLEPLFERFFGLMKLSDQTSVYVIDETGNIVFTNSNQQTTSYQSFKEKFEDLLSSNREGQFTTDKYLVAYAPISLGIQKWLLINFSPIQEAVEQAKPVYIPQTAMFILTTIIIFSIGTLVGRKKQV